MITARLTTRNDPAGAGHFDAPRGNRRHKGQDYACMPGSEILAPVSDNGQIWSVTKLGYPYGSGYGGAAPEGKEPVYRYVEMRDLMDRRHRIFYINPSVEPNDLVTCKTVIGIAQDVTLRYPQYPEMTTHIHYEIKLPDGSYVDPTL